MLDGRLMVLFRNDVFEAFPLVVFIECIVVFFEGEGGPVLFLCHFSMINYRKHQQSHNLA